MCNACSFPYRLMHHVSNQAYLIVYFLINSDQFACNQYLFNSKAQDLIEPSTTKDMGIAPRSPRLPWRFKRIVLRLDFYFLLHIF